MPKKVLAVGKNSFLAKRWCSSIFGRSHVSFIHHTDIGTGGILDQIDTVVSFCRHPVYDQQVLSPEEDPNRQIAEWLAPGNCKMVMLSSCKVYGPSSVVLTELNNPSPKSIGGINRLQSERLALVRLGRRLTILRCTNIFGFELNQDRPRFMAMLLRSLLEKDTVEFDCSLKTRRDFLPDCQFLELLNCVVSNPKPGIYNLGSGIPLKVGQIAKWVIEGYGNGKVIQTNDAKGNELLVDVSKLERIYGRSAHESEISESCKTIGRKLRNKQTAQ